MTSNEGGTTSGSAASNTADTPLRSIIETPLTDSLVTEIFHQQNNDGSFSPAESFDNLFNVNFGQIKQALKAKGLDASISDEIHRLISTASILFYFLYHSQKTKFPVDMETIKQFVSKARAELEGLSLKDDPAMQAFIEKGEQAVTFVIDTREKHAQACTNLKLAQPTWESYIQHLMGLDKQE